jgi:hypothetical protein
LQLQLTMMQLTMSATFLNKVVDSAKLKDSQNFDFFEFPFFSEIIVYKIGQQRIYYEGGRLDD